MNDLDSKTSCVYCGKSLGTTRDHIPSKNLFPDTREIDFITVPSCYECNNSLSKDEEFFRNMMCNLSLDLSESSKKLFEGKITRSIKRNPSLALKLFESMALVDMPTKDGLGLEKKTKITISVEDKKRINNVLTKYAKGLFYFHHKTPLPESFKLKIVWMSDQKIIPEIVKSIKITRQFNDVFAYGHANVLGTKNTVWLIGFYKAFVVLIFTVDKNVGASK